MNVKKSTEDSLDSVRVLFVFGVVFVLICFAFVGGDFCFYFFSVGKHYKGSLRATKTFSPGTRDYLLGVQGEMCELV